MIRCADNLPHHRKSREFSRYPRPTKRIIPIKLRNPKAGNPASNFLKKLNMKNLILLLLVLSVISCKRSADTKDEKNMSDTVNIDADVNDQSRTDSINASYGTNPDNMGAAAENTYASRCCPWTTLHFNAH